MILKYLGRRLLLTIPVLFGITLLAFLLGVLSPGNPAEIALSGGGEYAVTEKQISSIEEEMGLDKSYPAQYLSWIRGVLKGDWGTSFRTKKPVRDELFSRFGITLKLAVCAIFLTVAVGISLGILGAARRGRFIDKAGQGLSVLFLSIPSFWAAILLIHIFSERLHLLPTSGQDSWRHMVLPVIALSLNTTGTTIRLMRSSMLGELGKQYITAARGKGISERIVFLKHALINSLAPVVTLLGNYLGGILGGVVVVESVFAINGIGKFALDSIAVRDYPALQGYVLITGTAFVIIHMLVDLICYFLNPQIRLGEGETV
ncbi:ABC transporter permease [Qiania dongpingensis]|uniref:ABC transporter permease n=1 Tax=Qiania dongpingensis TaxID=2763669 RepID=A0A7G9G4S6_9FIRM|nr:ABC transporter permease [Qiania dongpingensis]QNM05808.1 ABC transporter permease [Qiania dongpingensis]